MPPAARYEERFARMKLKAHALGLVEQRELREVRMQHVADPRLVGPAVLRRVHELGLLGAEGDVFLVAIQLHQEGMGVKAVVVENVELRASAPDIHLDGRQLFPLGKRRLSSQLGFVQSGMGETSARSSGGHSARA